MRFLSVDPLAADYAAWSGYHYVLGNPLVFVDPDGRSADWVPEIGDSGEINLKAEAGDNEETLKSFLKGSKYEANAASLWQTRSHKGGTSVTLPENNYSQAFGFSLQNPDQFQGSTDNYNCYHFAISGAWEKEIFQPTLMNKLFGKGDGVPRLIDMEGRPKYSKLIFKKAMHKVRFLENP
jgi:hypothetical protein